MSKLPPTFSDIKFSDDNICKHRQDSYLTGIGVNTRVELKNLTHTTPNLEVKFDCKKSSYNGEIKDNSFDIALEVESDSDYYNFYSKGNLKEFIMNYCKEHSEELGCDDDLEVIEEHYKTKINQKDPYPPLLNTSIREDNYNGISFKKFLFDKNSKVIKNPNFEDKLKRGTTIKLIIDIPHFDVYNAKIVPCIKVQMIQILEEGKPFVKSFLELEDTDLNKLIIKDKQKNKHNGNFSYLNYDHDKYKGKLYNVVRDVKLASFPFLSEMQNKAEEDGAPKYGISVVIEDDEHYKYFNDMYDSLLKKLVDDSVNLLGSKKKKKVVQASFNHILRYGKEDKALIKKKEEPKYKPTISISANNYDNKFDFKFMDKDGKEMEEFFGDYKQTNQNSKYDIKFSLKHLWYGDKGISIKFVLEEIQIADEAGGGSAAFSFAKDGEGADDVDDADDDADADDDDAADDDTDDDSSSPDESGGGDGGEDSTKDSEPEPTDSDSDSE